MQVKDKIFSYPVINKNLLFSSYKKNVFALNYKNPEEITEDGMIFYMIKDCYYSTDSLLIKSLINENKANAVLIVECSSTFYRKKFEILEEPKDIKIPKGELNGNVCVSLFIYAANNFTLNSTEFGDDDYNDINFDIEKYDILGADDGFSFTVERDELEDNVAHSIFSIIKKENSNDNTYDIDLSSTKKVIITLSKNDYENYTKIHNDNNYKEVFFSMILIPALIECLNDCKEYLKNENQDLEQYSVNHQWFNSISRSYKKLFGNELTAEVLNNNSAAMLAQQLLGKPFSIAMNKLVEESRNIDGGF